MPAGIGKTLVIDYAALALASVCIFGCDERGGAPAPAQPEAAVERAGEDAGSDARSPPLDASTPGLDAAQISYVSIVDMDNWRRYDAAVDPLKAHQPDVIACQQSATYVEYGAFEVDTARCNYALSWTPSLRQVPAGTPFHLNILHYDLLAPEPAQAHLAVIFNDTVQWEQSIAIPAPGNAVDTTFVSTTALGFQDPIRLHLHNHGANTYLVVALEVRDR